MHDHFLEFLDLPARSAKPRSRGLTIVRDPGFPTDWLRGMLEAYGPLIDMVKCPIAVLTAPRKLMEDNIRLYRDYDVGVAVDDPMFSLAYHLGKVDPFFRALSDLGVTNIQVEVPRSHPDGDAEELRFLQLAREHGLRVDGEVGQKYTQGDVTRSPDGFLNVEATIAEAKRQLAQGCERVYFESAVIRSVLGNPATYEKGTQQIRAIVDGIGLDSAIIEINGLLMSFDDAQFTRFWAVKNFGPDVNMGGGEALTDIQFIEAVRRGISFVHGLNENPRLWVNSIARHGGRAAEDWWREGAELTLAAH
jgi:phosphosulfolactate synthase